METEVNNEWGGKAFWCEGSSNARGVGVIFSNRIHVEIVQSLGSENGRCLVIQFKLDSELYVLFESVRSQ